MFILGFAAGVLVAVGLLLALSLGKCAKMPLPPWPKSKQVTR